MDDNGNPLYEYRYINTDRYTASLSTGSQIGSWQLGVLYRYTASITGNTHYITFSVSSVDGWDNNAVVTPISPTKPTGN